MGDLAEYWKDVKPIYKQMHDERVAKTPSRIEYTIQKFTEKNIPFELKNEMTGQFNIRKSKDLIVYYCSTGKVLLNNRPKNARGIGYVIGLYKNLKEERKIMAKITQKE